MSDWYYLQGDVQVGPISLIKLGRLLEQQSCPPSVLVWNENLKDWTPASEVAELTDFSVASRSEMPTDVSTNIGGKKLGGIAGWLVLPALATVLSPMIIGYGVIGLVDAIGTNGVARDIRMFLLVEILVNLAMVVAWIYATFLLFKKRASFPSWFIGVSVWGAILLLADAVIANVMFNIKIDQQDVKAIAQSSIAAIVWGIYMVRSKRVRSTFVN